MKRYWNVIHYLHQTIKTLKKIFIVSRDVTKLMYTLIYLINFNVTEFKKAMQGKTSTKDLLLTSFAELLGTGVLVFLGCMGCSGGLTKDMQAPPHLQVTINFGVAVLIVIQVTKLKA